jgi:hypothetical protein
MTLFPPTGFTGVDRKHRQPNALGRKMADSCWPPYSPFFKSLVFSIYVSSFEAISSGKA